MKKKLTIPLLVLVMLIWGWILFKVIHASDDSLPMPNAPAQSHTPPKKAVAAADTVVNYQPQGGYPDPFLGTLAGPEPEIMAAEMPVENVAPPVEEVFVDWSVIKYLGEINSADAKKQVVLLSVGDKDFMLQEGQTQEGVTLLQNTNEYIKIKYQEKENKLMK